MSDYLRGYEQIADYAYLKQGRKYWRVYMGNPFVLSLRLALISQYSREEVVGMVCASQEAERKRFAAEFPDVEWKERTP